MEEKSSDDKINSANSDKIVKIINNYKNLEKEIVDQLNFECSHSTTIGTFREEIWKKLFERIIPKKFSIERSVFIIDSFGNISNEVDLAIFDENYTPYIFHYGEIKFIPIEAVAAVIECKSESFSYDNLVKWADSIKELKTGDNSIVRMHYSYSCENSTTQKSTRPIIIFCTKSDKDTKHAYNIFDIVINFQDDKLNIVFSNESNNNGNELIYWHGQLNFNNVNKIEKDEDNYKKCQDILKDKNLNEYKVKSENKEVTLLSFIFQFNQLLMIINNPIFFPHKQYVDMFNKYLTLAEKKKNEQKQTKQKQKKEQEESYA